MIDGAKTAPFYGGKMQNILEVDIKGYKAELPVLPLPSGVKIAFFNLHGNTKMTKHCADELAKLLDGCEVLLTAESKGLQLTHCIADKLGQDFYAVARKSQKLYMQDGISVTISSSITTGREQRLYPVSYTHLTLPTIRLV